MSLLASVPLVRSLSRAYGRTSTSGAPLLKPKGLLGFFNRLGTSGTAGRGSKRTKISLLDYPLAFNVLSLGVLYSGAEFTQQYFQYLFRNAYYKSGSETSFAVDLPSVRRYACLGVGVYGPLCTVWYKWLDEKFNSKSRTTIIKKLCFDQFLFGPVCLSLFFVVLAYLEGRESLTEECLRKFMPTFLAECFFWIPAQAMNFALVPSQYRVLFLGICMFVWLNALCIIKSIEKYQEIMDGK